MCKLCDQGQPQDHAAPSRESRRDFLKASTATAVAAAGLNLLTSSSARAQAIEPPPDQSGQPGVRYIIRGGSVMSMDPKVGDFAQADVLVEGKKILAVGPNLQADAGVIDARGRIVMPGFVDTHHHQFETVLRSFLADGILINDGSNTPSGNTTYYEYILLKFAPVFRPDDVYINEVFGGLSQLDAGVTTVFDISQIHHSPTHSDAAIQGLIDTGRRAAFGYFEGAGFTHGPEYQYPHDATRIKTRWFSSNDQLVTMIMGGEIYLPGYETAWQIGRNLGLQIAAHILSPFGMRPTFDAIAQGQGGDSKTLGIGPDNVFVHMTGMSDLAWQQRPAMPARTCLAGGPDRDEHAPRHAPDLQDAEAGHRAFAQHGRGVHADRRLLHPDALDHESAAGAREPDGPQFGIFPESAGLLAGNTINVCPICSRRAMCCATPPSTAQSACGWTARPAR